MKKVEKANKALPKPLQINEIPKINKKYLMLKKN